MVEAEVISPVILFIVKYKWIFLFYVLAALFILLTKKRWEIHAKIIYLYRTSLGLAWMDAIANKYREIVKLVSLIGVGIGFTGMIVIAVTLIISAWQLVTVPEAPASVGLVLPETTIPGIGVLPFHFWLITIFIIAVVHEFSHGVVARAHNVRVQSSGIAFIGPILAAFVEPEEKKLAKQSDVVQYSVFAAGPFANILLGFFAILASLLLLNFSAGIEVVAVNPGMPAEAAGLPQGTIITQFNSQQVSGVDDLQAALTAAKGKEDVHVVTASGQGYILNMSGRDKMGVQLRNSFGIGMKAAVLNWVNDLLFWLRILSFGIGLFNLLPLGPVDGGRMFRIAMHRLVRNRKSADAWFRNVSIAFFVLLVLLLTFPFVRTIF
ncbi:site-2 protease family protein [Candidatus Woesearchaeota archaeon]|nr:site-2 protease family protein [Candidatus Woesearchaeota archaeon]